jgi:hypothetical protein
MPDLAFGGEKYLSVFLDETQGEFSLKQSGWEIVSSK